MTRTPHTPSKPANKSQWTGYQNPVWRKKDKKKVTLLYSFVERRKSLMLRAYFERHGFSYEDLGDHIKEDVRWGKEYGNRMECNPMYFTSGALIRALKKLEEKGLSKQEIVDNYIFLGGGGQCGPCRYGMYPQEYLKVVNEAGFEGFRILIFGSDLVGPPPHKDSAFKINLPFRINMLIAVILADFLHIAECALRPRAEDKEHALKIIVQCEQLIFDAFCNKYFLFEIPKALRQASLMLSKVKVHKVELPKIFVTGEFFANLAHNDGNYNLRRFIMDEGCEAMPGIFTQRILYDNWRRTREAHRGIEYASSKKETKFWKKSLRKQRFSTATVNLFYSKYKKAFNPEAFGGKAELMNLDHLAELAKDYYHPEIFGGEGNLEIAEAIHMADSCDGFISSKPFGCMASSGVSDGVQTKIMSKYPQLDFLSIETSGDNEVSILGRVSMLLFKAKQRVKDRRNRNQTAAVALQTKSLQNVT